MAYSPPRQRRLVFIRTSRTDNLEFIGAQWKKVTMNVIQSVLPEFELLTPLVMLSGYPATNGDVLCAVYTYLADGQGAFDMASPCGPERPVIGLLHSRQKSKHPLRVFGFCRKHGTRSAWQYSGLSESGITLLSSSYTLRGPGLHTSISFLYRRQMDALKIWHIMLALGLSLQMT
jgi:hypothetical protein